MFFFQIFLTFVFVKSEEIMTTSAMNNLWTYLQGLPLSSENRQWLVERLTEYPSPPYTVDALVERAERGHRQIAEGQCYSTEEVFREFEEDLQLAAKDLHLEAV